MFGVEVNQKVYYHSMCIPWFLSTILKWGIPSKKDSHKIKIPGLNLSPLRARTNSRLAGGFGDHPNATLKLAIWVWLKINQEGQTAGFGPCFHLPGLDFGAGLLSHSHLGLSYVFARYPFGDERKPQETTHFGDSIPPF